MASGAAGNVVNAVQSCVTTSDVPQADSAATAGASKIPVYMWHVPKERPVQTEIASTRIKSPTD
jgi:hypothetical protein